MSALASRAPRTESERRDQACDQFEAAWRAGGFPRIEEHLSAVPPLERPALLGELLATELELRLAAGELPRAEDYTARFAGQEVLIGSALALAIAAGCAAPAGF